MQQSATGAAATAYRIVRPQSIRRLKMTSFKSCLVALEHAGRRNTTLCDLLSHAPQARFLVAPDE